MVFKFCVNELKKLEIIRQAIMIFIKLIVFSHFANEKLRLEKCFFDVRDNRFSARFLMLVCDYIFWCQLMSCISA